MEMAEKKVNPWEDLPTASSVDTDEEKTLSEDVNPQSLLLEHLRKDMNLPRDSFRPQKLKLRFINSPPPMIYTDSMIVGEDGNPLTIELVDALTNTRVHISNSPLHIVPLNADIRERNWTTDEFNRNIIRPREGRQRLLMGDLTVTLKNGVGVIGGDVAFTDNSSWLRSGKFRLGAKMPQGIVSVSEAITNAFKCKNKRGISYQKQYPPPYSGSEAWRIDKNIAKSGLTESTSARGNLSDQQNPKLQLHSHSHRRKRPRPVFIETSASDFRNVVHRHTGLHSSVSLDSNRVNLQEDELGIGFNESQSINVTDGPVSDANDVFTPPIITSATFPASQDYDVVIRHGGNNDFISHLRAALSRRGLSVHEDSEEETDAVPECRVLIIFLTPTYLPPNLFNILQHQRKKSQVVYPVFYGMSPSDLITDSKYYENYYPQDKLEEWQIALRQIAHIPGYILIDKYESELIDEIVKDALKVIFSTDNEKMIGMDMQIKEILSLLCIESPYVRSLGIWGAVGIGKTALAEEIFSRISLQFETCVFLKDLHKEVEEKGQDSVTEDLLSKVLEVEPHVIRISGMEKKFLWSRVQRKKVLVVLDDVNDFGDVEIFLEELSYFGPGSRIIITSRDKRVFVLCKTDHVYEVKPLDFSTSLQILDRGTYSPELVKFSNGNPQVLQFLSSSNREWKLLTQEIKSSSPIYIQGIFERSCCGLDDIERSIFLDIACFFKRMNKSDVTMLLDGRDFSAHVGFSSLVDKSLLTISHNMVDMPSFLQATGREIVRQESVDRPGDRSRLWNAEDIRDVFMDNTGTSAIEGIFLDMSQLKFDARPIVFMKMNNIRHLKLYFSKVKENDGVCLPQGLEYLPRKLRLLHWEYYPLSSLPQTFDPKNLVELNLPNSCAKKLWKGKKSLEKLKKLRLSHSYHLTKIPRLSTAPNLELLDLEGCKSLVSISQSISYLKKLVFLNLKDCSNLESVPCTVDLESLEVLNLSGCSKLENFPEISPNVKELCLGGTMIQEIPSSIKNLVLLEKLDLENSKDLKNLPTSICKLKHLETLNLSGCSSLEQFPDLTRKMKYLTCLDLSRTAIKELPSSISYLTALEELRFVGCKSLVRLPDNVWSLRFKVEFRQIDTEKFSKLWNRFAWLKKVKIS